MMYSPVAAYEQDFKQYEIPEKPSKLTTQYIKQLVNIKDEMEKEILHLNLSLDKLGVGLKGSLLDKDGFPRSDMDLNDVASKRHRIACLQNDFSSLMDTIQNYLFELHEETRANNPNSQVIDIKPFDVESLYNEDEL
ncbi:hypothetical protein NAEGRDRAFT_68057 [Naegleria gruberi]|uniref:Uncharacterized protein FM147 n=1 Tax=Naegleria gruberi TaxID=5762 RepID=D2VGQ2_NAEGR|nr:uncharacterized protein NAEGRDRAFT_68057 [Naegleria gruberi]EFC44007.1 hypothetical protein NAEGRDRAFT_68057 [Naegleria gruberi]|eukprot:XP_002676751.1 hypothetical protein NAEGRDRAFT_68057 [Naegleria gruberi strain NEG-M]